MPLSPIVRTSLVAILSLVGFAGCGDDAKSTGPAAPKTPAPAPDAHATPAALAEAIFAAARSGQFAELPGLVDPKEPDGDAKRVGSVGTAPAAKQEEFKSYFATGKISGDVKVEGDTAAVPILFGPDGTKPETFNLVRRDGKWYLQSF